MCQAKLASISFIPKGYSLEAKVWTNALKLIKFTCTVIFVKLRQESRKC